MTWINKTPAKCLAGAVLIASIALLVDGLSIYLKAQLAQQLIQYAWSETRLSGQPVKPWPWADTWPVARLTIANRDLYILQGADGSALAFGPGWMADSVNPSQPGAKLIAGHRDTHFSVLEHLQPNDTITLTPHQGQPKQYAIANIKIIDSSQQPLLVDPDKEQLILITCYPFNAIDPGGPQRYIVNALPRETLTL